MFLINIFLIVVRWCAMDVSDVIFVDNSLIKTLVWGNTLQWKRETWILELGKVDIFYQTCKLYIKVSCKFLLCEIKYSCLSLTIFLLWSQKIRTMFRLNKNTIRHGKALILSWKVIVLVKQIQKKTIRRKIGPKMRIFFVEEVWIWAHSDVSNCYGAASCQEVFSVSFSIQIFI